MVPVDVQRHTVNRNGTSYDNFAISCSFPTAKLDSDGNPISMDVDLKLVPVETNTPVLYNLLRLIFGEAKEKQLCIVKTVRYAPDNKEIPNYSARVLDEDAVAGEIYCDFRPQGTGDRVMFNLLVNALKHRGLIE